jgi:hypothetical protein
VQEVIVLWVKNDPSWIAMMKTNFFRIDEFHVRNLNLCIFPVSVLGRL